MPNGPPSHRLIAHPQTPGLAVQALRVVLAAAPARDGWQLRYELAGDLAALRLPAHSANPGPADGLWQHSCFEAFVGCSGADAYLEFNFSPSGDWAAYAFRAPRKRAGTGHLPLRPRLHCVREAHRFVLDAWLPRALAACLPRAPDRIGLSAVIEQADGQLSYWALAHPAARPDFHQRAAWTARLPALANL